MDSIAFEERFLREASFLLHNAVIIPSRIESDFQYKTGVAVEEECARGNRVSRIESDFQYKMAMAMAKATAFLLFFLIQAITPMEGARDVPAKLEDQQVYTPQSFLGPLLGLPWLGGLPLPLLLRAPWLGLGLGGGLLPFLATPNEAREPLNYKGTKANDDNGNGPYKGTKADDANGNGPSP